MHRKHIRATDATSGVDVDVPTAVWVDGQFLIYTGGVLSSQFVVQSHNTSTDNAIARWDGTTGHLIQDSTVIVDDAGNMTGVGTINGNDISKFVRGPTPAVSTNTAIALWNGTGGRDIQNSVVTMDSSGNLTGVGTLNGFDPLRWIRYTPDYFPYHNEVLCVDNSDPITGLPIGASGRTVKIAGFGVMYDVVSLNGRDPMQWVDGPITHVATNNHIALWDTNSGRLIKDSLVSVDPVTGDITTPGDMTPTTVGGIPVGLLVKSSGGTPHPNHSVARWRSGAGNPIDDSTVFLDDIGNFTSMGTLNGRTIANWVDGPSSATSGNLARFADASGKLVSDTGIPSSNVVRFALGSTDNAVVRWDGAAGQVVQNCVVIISDTGAVTGVTTLNTRDPSQWVDGPASGGSTDNTLAVWDGTSGRLLKNGGATSIAVDPGTGIITTPVGVLVHSGATHTDNAVVRWDGTGSHTQDSTVIVDDSGNVTGLGTLNTRAIANWVESSSTFPTAGRILVAASNGTRLIQPTGVLVTDFVVGPGSSVNNNLMSFSGTGGHTAQDSGIAANSVVTGPGTSVVGNIAVFNNTTGNVLLDSGILASSVFFSRTWATRSGFAGTSGFDIYPSSTVISLPNTVGTLSFVAWVPYTASVGSNIVVTVSWSGLTLGSGGGQQVGVSTGLQGTGITSSGGSATLGTAAGQVAANGIIHMVGSFTISSTTPTITLNIKSSSGSHTLGVGVIIVNQGTQA